MTEFQPELFDGCNNELPSWGVTRQFDFGQFVVLYDERVIDGKRVVTPIVLSDEGDIVVPDPPDNNGQGAASQPATSVTGGVPLHMLYEGNDAVEIVTNPLPTPVPIENTIDFLRNGSVTVDDVTYSASLTPDAKLRLATGQPVTVIGRTHDDGDGGERRELLRLISSMQEVELNEDEFNRLLASGEFSMNGQRRKGRLSVGAVKALLSGGEVVLAADSIENDENASFELYRIRGQALAPRPAVTRYPVRDLAGFIAAPTIPGTNNRALPVQLTTEGLRELRVEGRTTVHVEGVDVDVITLPDQSGDDGMVLDHETVLRRASPNRTPEREPVGLGDDSSGGATVSTRPAEVEAEEVEAEEVEAEIEPEVKAVIEDPPEEPPLQQTPLRRGLQLAILLPWRQLWTLEGLSRGSLLSTIALAPGEETTVTIQSWERRAKALEQSTETEVDQQVDFSQTTRDTEDVFREMASRHDFQSQLHGNLDASYTNGVASVSVGVDGGVNNTDSLTNVLRTTQNHMREVTSRASTRVRSRRITKITESVEQGLSEEVVRRIRNPNQCHTLTLDFHEVLAHHRVDTTFLASRVRVVVLVPNPVSVRQFDDLLVRKNETALRLALLDPALAEGFEACRLLDSYEFAKQELRALSAEDKKVAELDREREKDDQKEKPPNPHEGKVLDVLKDVKEAAAPLKAAQITPALNAIRKHQTVTANMRQQGQRWMFVRLCQTKIAPAFVNALFALADDASPDLADARRFLDTLPGPGANPSLDTVNSLPDTDKEQAGLDAEIKSQPGYVAWDWGWWTGRCREEALYGMDDAGLSASARRLREAWQDYEAKAAEGEGIALGNQLAENAQSAQDEASYLDKLEMKYGVEVVAEAQERREALLGHLNDYPDHYRYVLFQALPPGEQLRRLMDVAPQLQVGMFEPHVVAVNGPYLAVPLTPVGESKLAKTLSTLRNLLQQASTEAAEAAEEMGENKLLLPTPGISVESRLGRCNGCEEHVQHLQAAEIRRARADVRLAELEADRRAARLKAKPPELDNPAPAVPTLGVQITDGSPS